MEYLIKRENCRTSWVEGKKLRVPNLIDLAQQVHNIYVDNLIGK